MDFEIAGCDAWSLQPANNILTNINVEIVAMRIAKYLPLILLILIVVVLSADNSFAVSTDTMTQIQTKFQTVAAQYMADLKKYAFALFKIFILVDIAIFGVRAALNRSEIGEVISQFLIMLLFVTFCAVAINYYEIWTNYLLEESKTIAAAVGGSGINLNPIDTGFKILNSVIDAITNLPSKFSSIIYGLGYLMIGGVIMVCFCLMSARMLIVLCESYIAMAAAVLLLGFGGSLMLKDYAINTMRYAVSVAFKLFVMRLVLGVGMSFVTGLGTITQVTFELLFTILAAAIVLYVLIQTMSETVAGIINGSHVGSGVGLGSAARGIAVAGMGAAAAIGGAAIAGGQVVQTVSRAQKLASMSGSGGIGGTASQLLNSFKAAWQQDGRMGGMGSTLQRMRANTNDMYQAQQAMKDPNFKANPYADTGKNPYMSPLSKLGGGFASGAAGPGAGPGANQPGGGSVDGSAGGSAGT